MAAGFSKEVFNTREEVVSSDLMRMQSLASRELQNTVADGVRSMDCGDPGSPSNANMFTSTGSPLGSIGQAPTLSGPSGFTLQLGAGSGFINSATGVTVDDSSFQVLRWATQTVTFTNPHGTLPRIDVVYATLGSVATDSSVRNVLVDPGARTVAAQAVNKTSNPQATIGVQAGTAASTPLVPAIPADSLALFYVWVPAAVGSAANFGICRASWRRASYPFTGMSRVLTGMGFKWDLTVDPAVASSEFVTKGLHRIVIDGEVMEFYANLQSNAGGMAVDSGANPFAVAASATWNKPYYLYAVGGRRNPLPSFNTVESVLAPVTIVESLTPPNVDTGKASLNMSVNGVAVDKNATCYVGLGFVAANTTNRLGCFMDGTWTVPGGISPTVNRLVHTATTTATAEALGSITSKPNISTRMRATVTAQSVTAKLALTVYPDDGSGTAIAPAFLGISGNVTVETGLGATPFQGLAQGEIHFAAGNNGTLWSIFANVGDVLTVYPQAFDHRVGGLGASVTP